MVKIKHISYFCFADTSRSDPLYRQAYELAKFMAQRGFITINGGGPGSMRAVSEGAKAGGGTVIGVTFYPKDITNFEGRDPNNPIDEEVVTKNYLERTLKLLELGDVYIVLAGGTGTISEFGMAWGMANLYYGHHKPLILYGSFWKDIIEAFVNNMRVRPEDLRVYRIVKSPQEALSAISEFERIIFEKKDANKEEKAFEL